MSDSMCAGIVLIQFLIGAYIGYKIGFYKGQAEGFVQTIIHVAYTLRKTFREVDTVTNGPYTIDRVVNLLGIEEIYNLTDHEVPEKDSEKEA